MKTISVNRIIYAYLLFAILSVFAVSPAHSECLEMESADLLFSVISTKPALIDLRPLQKDAKAVGWDEDGHSVLLRSTKNPEYFETIKRALHHIVDIEYWFNGKRYEYHSIAWGNDFEVDFKPMREVHIFVQDEDDLVCVANYDIDYDKKLHRYTGYRVYKDCKGKPTIEKVIKYKNDKVYECDKLD